MALQSLIFSKDGSAWLNSLKRYALSAVVVPQQNLLVAKVPAAQSITQPGRATPIPLQGPADASTELYSFTGKQGVVNQGIGTITTTGTTTVTGVGTKFASQLQVGDVIATAAGNGVIATVVSNTIATTTLALAVNTNADFFFSTTALRTFGENIFVSIQDQAWRRRLMNRDVPAIHVFGSNTKPLFIKESLLLETDQTLVLEFLNYSTSGPASFAPISEGRKWQYEALKDPKIFNFIKGLRERKQFIQPYWMTIDKGWSTLAIGDTRDEYFTCTGDITQFLFNLYGQAFADSGGADVSNTVLVQFFDAKTQRAIMSQPMPLSCIAGTAENPMRLPTPWIVEPQTQIRATFKNNSGVACKAYMTFHGTAIYTGSSWRGSTLTNKYLREQDEEMYRASSEPQVIPADSQG